MSNIDKKRLEEIEKERDDLYEKINKLDDEAFRIENEDALEVGENAIGKFYKKKDLSFGCNDIFHPVKLNGKHGLSYLCLTLSGEYARGISFLIGSASIFMESDYPIRIEEFKACYEEISEEEYNNTKASMLNYFK